MSERHLHHILIASAFLITALISLSFCGMGPVAQATPSELQHRIAGKETGLSQPVRPLTATIRAYGIELAEVEQAYDATLYQVLSYFFEPGTFLPDVRVEAQARTTDVHTTSPEEAVRIITNLPGLPHFEEETTIAGSSVTTISKFFTGIELKRLHITIYADTSYGQDELELMQQLVIAAAKVETTRGDKVHIIPQPFPRERSQPGSGWKVTTSAQTKKIVRAGVDATDADATDVDATDVDVTGVDADAVVADDTHVRETAHIRLKRPVAELPALVLLISSALLIFVIIYITISLRKRYV